MWNRSNIRFLVLKVINSFSLLVPLKVEKGDRFGQGISFLLCYVIASGIKLLFVEILNTKNEKLDWFFNRR